MIGFGLAIVMTVPTRVTITMPIIVQKLSSQSRLTVEAAADAASPTTVQKQTMNTYICFGKVPSPCRSQIVVEYATVGSSILSTSLFGSFLDRRFSIQKATKQLMIGTFKVLWKS